jgi:hypothetical protein
MHASGLQPLPRAAAVVRYAGVANGPVKAAFREAGWRAVKKGSGSRRFLVCWGHIFSAQELASLHEFQRVNHFPGALSCSGHYTQSSNKQHSTSQVRQQELKLQLSQAHIVVQVIIVCLLVAPTGTWELGRKDYLYRNVNALRRLKVWFCAVGCTRAVTRLPASSLLFCVRWSRLFTFPCSTLAIVAAKRTQGARLDIIPPFFILPRDAEEFKTDMERNPGQLYIQKVSRSAIIQHAFCSAPYPSAWQPCDCLHPLLAFSPRSQ